jgi:hypothetical protein
MYLLSITGDKGVNYLEGLGKHTKAAILDGVSHGRKLLIGSIVSPTN